jgi:hypothetical protein
MHSDDCTVASQCGFPATRQGNPKVDGSRSTVTSCSGVGLERKWVALTLNIVSAGLRVPAEAILTGSYFLTLDSCVPSNDVPVSQERSTDDAAADIQQNKGDGSGKMQVQEGETGSEQGFGRGKLGYDINIKLQALKHNRRRRRCFWRVFSSFSRQF